MDFSCNELINVWKRCDTGSVLIFLLWRLQVIKMLAVVFVFFAVLWLPYRSLVVYNSFSIRPIRSRANLLFCRLMVYVNSAVNPVLYNALSIKFRRAFLRLMQLSIRGHPGLADRHLARRRILCRTEPQGAVNSCGGTVPEMRNWIKAVGNN